MYTALHYENRINTLRHRGKENQNIIRKLTRQWRRALERERGNI